MKKIGKFFLILVLIIMLLAVSGIIYIKQISKPVVADGDYTQDVRVEIPYGTSVSAVGSMLRAQGLIRNEKIFYYCARYPQLKKLLFPGLSEEAYVFSLKSGIYHIRDNMNICDIQQLLSSGQQEYIKISIPEGYTISQIADLLETGGVCNSSDFKAVCKGSELCKKYGIPGDSCEGYLFPDTYFFTAGMSAVDIASLMIDNFYDKISYIDGMSGLNADDLYYAVRLASIVEREYRLEEEAPLIASVFKNRLRYNIGLYSCATVVYIITEIQGKPHPDRVLISDTKIDSPYNTYLYAGLPPGAISNPGRIALDAAVNTPKTSYYYFQVADTDEGRHVFSKSFEDHIENRNLVTKKQSGK